MYPGPAGFAMPFWRPSQNLPRAARAGWMPHKTCLSCRVARLAVAVASEAEPGRQVYFYGAPRRARARLVRRARPAAPSIHNKTAAEIAGREVPTAHPPWYSM